MSASLSTHDLIQSELVGVDEALRASERKWGVGRLVKLIPAETLAKWKLGFDRWNNAIESADLSAVRELAPKIRQALAVMDKQATAAGHAELVVNAFETRLDDGRVLRVVRTAAEAHAASYQAEGRDMTVWTMEELARIMPKLELLYAVKAAFPGARVEQVIASGRGETAAQKWVSNISNERWNEIHAEDAAALNAAWRDAPKEAAA